MLDPCSYHDFISKIQGNTTVKHCSRGLRVELVLSEVQHFKQHVARKISEVKCIPQCSFVKSGTQSTVCSTILTTTTGHQYGDIYSSLHDYSK